MSHPTPPRPSRLRRILVTLLVLLLGLVLAAAAVIWRWGPNFGLYLTAPSPSRYADTALGFMDGGQYAHGPRWETARADAVRATREAPSIEATLPALRKALAVAGGKHSALLEPDRNLDAQDTRPVMPTVTTRNGVATLVVPQQLTSDPEVKQRYTDTLADGIQAARTATGCGWVVDLRHNHGGDMSPMIAGLSPLLPQGRLLGTRYADGTQQWVELSGSTVQVNGEATMTAPDHGHVDQPVAVLQGPDNGSAGEAALLALRAGERVRTFGGPTAGYSSANRTYRLYDGTQMLLTVGSMTDHTGRSTGEQPVQPDRAVPVATAHQQATAWLAQQCR